VDAVLGWVVREATTNVLRHSGARSVAVDLSEDGDLVRLAVIDDGRGGDGPRGTGLAGLAERVEALGGRLDAGPAGGRGFRLSAVVPTQLPAKAGAR
jgi:two-component system sensor histidine kinase DesK